MNLFPPVTTPDQHGTRDWRPRKSTHRPRAELFLAESC
jgi:hypothetical protein